MAWPTESGILVSNPRRRRRAVGSIRARLKSQRDGSPATMLGRYYGGGESEIRIFGPAEYRFYRTLGSPPAETDTAYATATSLPATPATTFGDGVWYVGVQYFNGVALSGFYPIGPSGEPYRILDISGGVALPDRPADPVSVSLVARAGGVVEITAVAINPGYDADAGELRAWAIRYTTDGSTPVADSPSHFPVFGSSPGVERLSYLLPAQADATAVKVRIQVRHYVTSWRYSVGAAVLTISADAAGPAEIEGGERWVGGLPEIS